MVSRLTAYTYYCSTFGVIRLPCIPFLHTGKKIKIPFISFILLFLISSIGPWRFSEITRYTMHKRIDTLIQNNKTRDKQSTYIRQFRNPMHPARLYRCHPTTRRPSLSHRELWGKRYTSLVHRFRFLDAIFQTHTRDNICIESLTGKSSHLFFLLPIGFLRRQKHKYKRLPIRPVFRWKFKYPNEQRQCRNIGARQYRCRRLSASRPTKKNKTTK